MGITGLSTPSRVRGGLSVDLRLWVSELVHIASRSICGSMVVLTARALCLFDCHTRMRVHPSSGGKGAVWLLCGQVGNVLSCEFGRLPSDLTPYSGCAELPIGDVLSPHDTCDTAKERYTLYTRYSHAKAQATQSVLTMG